MTTKKLLYNHRMTLVPIYKIRHGKGISYRGRMKNVIVLDEELKQIYSINAGHILKQHIQGEIKTEFKFPINNSLNEVDHVL